MKLRGITETGKASKAPCKAAAAAAAAEAAAADRRTAATPDSN